MRGLTFKFFLPVTLAVFCSLAVFPQNEALSITERPSAGYTDEARDNNIEGTVALKVEFRDDGMIGVITDVTKPQSDRERLFKYGLTASAVLAAKKIKFRPARKDGHPVTVVKVIMYQFSL